MRWPHEGAATARVAIEGQLLGTNETCRHVRKSVAIGRGPDMPRFHHASRQGCRIVVPVHRLLMICE
jgi:hypothetical protein